MSNRNVAVADYGDSISDTTQIGGSRFPFWNGPAGLSPQGYGPVLQNQSYALPSVPPTYGEPSGSGSIAQTADMTSALNAGSNPLSLKQSPLLWAIVGVFGGLFAIHHIAWKGE